MALPLIIEPHELHAAMQASQKLLIIDLGKAETYAQAHIPGALHVPPADIQLGTKPAPGKLPPAQQLSLLFSRLGLTEDTHVVVYDDDGGPWAGRMIWVLDSIGHKSYSFLNGGIHSWLAEKLPVDNQPAQAAASGFQVDDIDSSVTIEKHELLEAIQNQQIQIWDARSYKEYTGEKVVSARGGHLPGARSYEFSKALDMNAHMRLRPLQDIKQELMDLGIDGEQTIATHCQTHRRSGLTYVICKALGWSVRAYDGSWSEWGNDDSLPVNTGETP